jgi:DNA-binding beta-propeller fold protein YncE
VPARSVATVRKAFLVHGKQVGHPWVPRDPGGHPDGKTAYVVNNGDGTVTPVSIITGKAIGAGTYPVSIAIAR